MRISQATIKKAADAFLNKGYFKHKQILVEADEDCDHIIYIDGEIVAYQNTNHLGDESIFITVEDLIGTKSLKIAVQILNHLPGVLITKWLRACEEDNHTYPMISINGNKPEEWYGSYREIKYEPPVIIRVSALAKFIERIESNKITTKPCKKRKSASARTVKNTTAQDAA